VALSDEHNTSQLITSFTLGDFWGNLAAMRKSPLLALVQWRSLAAADRVSSVVEISSALVASGVSKIWGDVFHALPRRTLWRHVSRHYCILAEVLL